MAAKKKFSVTQHVRTEKHFRALEEKKEKMK